MSNKVSETGALGARLKTFSNWAHFQALKMRLDAVGAIEWSLGALESFAAHAANPLDEGALEKAAADALREIDASPQRALALVELSKFLALPIPAKQDDEARALSSPLHGSALYPEAIGEAPTLVEGSLEGFAQMGPNSDFSRTSGNISEKKTSAIFPAARTAPIIASRIKAAAEGRAKASASMEPAEHLLDGTIVLGASHVDDFVSIAKSVYRRLLAGTPLDGPCRSADAVGPEEQQSLNPALSKKLQQMFDVAALLPDALSEDEAYAFSSDSVGSQRFNAFGGGDAPWKDPDAESGKLYLGGALIGIADANAWPREIARDSAIQGGGDEELRRAPIDMANLVVECRAAVARLSSGVDGRGASDSSMNPLIELAVDIALAGILPLADPESISGWRASGDWLEWLDDKALDAIDAIEDGEGGMLPRHARNIMDDFVRAAGEARFEAIKSLSLNQDGSIPTASGDSGEMLRQLAGAHLRFAMDAAEVAVEREAHWATSELGSPELSGAIARMDLSLLTTPAVEAAASQAALASAKRLPEVKIVDFFELNEDGGNDSPRSWLGRLGLGSADLVKFASSPSGEGFIEVCVEILGKGTKSAALAKRWLAGEGSPPAAMALMMAFVFDWRHSEGQTAWRSPLPNGRAKALANLMGEAKERRAKISQLATNLGEMAEVFPMQVAERLSPMDCLTYWGRRHAEAARQAELISHDFFEAALAGKLLDMKMEPLTRFSLDGRAGGQSLAYLPLEWDGDDEALRLMGRQDGPLAAEVKEILSSEGFAGEMAQIAADMGRKPNIREGVAAQSVANAWLGEGRLMAKEWLGIGDAAWKVAKSDPETAGWLLAEAKTHLAGWAEARQAAERVEQAAVERQRGASLGKPERLSNLLELCAQASLPPSRAIALAGAVEARSFGSGKMILGEVAKKRTFDSLLKEGLSSIEAVDLFKREAEAAQAIEARWNRAWLARADALLKEFGEGASVGKRDIDAVSYKLRTEISDIKDWADDNAATFYSRLPAKLTWATLAAGSERWHQEVQLRALPEDKSSWQPIGLSWQSADGSLSLRELRSAKELHDEGLAMRHCVGTYSDSCINGDKRIIGIIRGAERISTLELSASGKRPASKNGRLDDSRELNWQVTQHRARNNQAPPREALDAEGAIVREANQRSLAAFERKALLLQEDEASREVRFKALAIDDLELPGFDAMAALRQRRAQADTLEPAKTADMESTRRSEAAR